MLEFNLENVKAISLLLEDPSKEVQLLMREQLLKYSMAELKCLQKKLAAVNISLNSYMNELVRQKKMAAAIVELESLVFYRDFNLEKLVCFIARFIEDDLTDEVITHQLDELALGCMAYINSSPDDEPEEALSQYLGHVCDFVGNEENFYAIKNSSINCVLKTKKGSPIILSILYILIGKRVGVPISGIALPGHFVASIKKGDRMTYIDPYNRGRFMSVNDCKALIKRSGYPFSNLLLGSVDTKTIFYRILNNLKFIFEKESRLQEKEALEVMIRLWAGQVLRQPI